MRISKASLNVLESVDGVVKKRTKQRSKQTSFFNIDHNCRSYFTGFKVSSERFPMLIMGDAPLKGMERNGNTV